MSSANAHSTTQQRAAQWAEILHRNQKWLWTVTRSREPSEQEAADILQEVACTLVQSGPSPKEIERVEPWLYRVVIRHVQMHRRRQGRHRKHCEQWGHAQATDVADEGSSLDWLLREESREQVRASLSRLREIDRDILLLKYVEQWSYDKIGRHLGITRHAVEYRLQRARRTMRYELSERGVEAGATDPQRVV